jgi:hypothetical protein
MSKVIVIFINVRMNLLKAFKSVFSNFRFADKILPMLMLLTYKYNPIFTNNVICQALMMNIYINT